MGTANGDGDFTNPFCTRCYDYRVLDFDRTHVVAINYVYNLPRFSRYLSDNWLVKGVVDGWEVSGITQFMTGQPTEVTFSIPGVNLGQRITGSYTEAPRIYLTAPPQNFDLSRDNWFDFAAFRLPDVGDTGPWPRNYLRRPGINVTDLSIFKNFSLGADSTRRLQLRVEMFNVFNQAQFHDMNRGLTFNIASNFSNFAANQQASIKSIQNLRVGPDGRPVPNDRRRLGLAVGEVNTQPNFVSPNRVIQLAAKIYF